MKNKNKNKVEIKKTSNPQTAIIPYSSIHRVSVLLPYSADVNTKKVAIWDVFRAEGIEADIYLVATRRVKGFCLTSPTMVLGGRHVVSCHWKRLFKSNLTHFIERPSDVLFNLCEDFTALRIAEVSPAKCRIGINCDSPVYNFILKGQGSEVELFENIFKIVKTFE